MVADIQLLQGKIIDDPDQRVNNISALIEELSKEFLAVQNASAASPESVAAIAELPAAEPLAGTA